MVVARWGHQCAGGFREGEAAGRRVGVRGALEEKGRTRGEARGC
jgi:hypothetical protein